MSYQSKTISPFDFYANSLIENVNSNKTAASPKGYLLHQLLGALGAGTVGGATSYGIGATLGTDDNERRVVTGLSMAVSALAGRGVGKGVWMNKHRSLINSPQFTASYPKLAPGLQHELTTLANTGDILNKNTKGLLAVDAAGQAMYGLTGAGIRNLNSGAELNRERLKLTDLEGLKLKSDMARNRAEMDALKNPKSQQQLAPAINVTTPEIKIPEQPAPVVTVNNSTSGNGSDAAPKSMIDKFPGGPIGLGVAAGLAIPSVYALYHFSRAAEVIGDGRSIRLSGSLRKRRGQATDLNFGVAPYKPPTQKELDAAAKARAALPGGGAFDDEAGFADEEEF